jgi:hypothetical protein
MITKRYPVSINRQYDLQTIMTFIHIVGQSRKSVTRAVRYGIRYCG